VVATVASNATPTPRAASALATTADTVSVALAVSLALLEKARHVDPQTGQGCR
jgi:hypothetical protein